MQLKARDKVLSLDQPVVMGILNVTPDSFSDGGRWNTLTQAVRHARDMLEQGALIIDVGGESTRPGARPVTPDEELERVIPVIEALSSCTDAVLSVDTSQPAVMAAAFDAGAHLWNDVRALTLPGAAETAARLGVPVVLTHMRGTPRTMQDHPRYDDVIAEVRDFLLKRASDCQALGIQKENIILDPGFGFGKSLEDNYRLLRRLDELAVLGYPVLSALSRKSMIGAACDIPRADMRITGSVAGALISVMKGARLLRVHDVKQTLEALRVFNAMNHEG